MKKKELKRITRVMNQYFKDLQIVNLKGKFVFAGESGYSDNSRYYPETNKMNEKRKK